MQRVRQHVHGRLFPGDQFAVEPDVGCGWNGHVLTPRPRSVRAARCLSRRVPLLRTRAALLCDNSMRLMTSSSARPAASMMLVLMLEPR